MDDGPSCPFAPAAQQVLVELGIGPEEPQRPARISPVGYIKNSTAWDESARMPGLEPETPETPARRCTAGASPTGSDWGGGGTTPPFGDDTPIVQK